MKILITTWAGLWVSSIFFIVLFPISLLFWRIKDVNKRLARIAPFWSLFGQVCLRIACLARATIIDKRAQVSIHKDKSVMYISNHLSFMDIPLLLTKIQIIPIMKSEVLKIPFFGIVARASGALAVDRNDKNSRKKIVLKTMQLLQNNTSIQYYPEGTRSRTGSPKPYTEIKTSLIDYCYDNNIQVIPISLYGTDKILSRNGMVRPLQNVGMILHEEISPSNFKSREEFSRACWEDVINGFHKLEQISSKK